MFEKERSEIRILSNIADAQGLGYARDLLRKAEYEFQLLSEHYEKQYCTTDVGDGLAIYDTRPRR